MKRYRPTIFIYGYGRVGGTLYRSFLRERFIVKVYSRGKRGRDLVSLEYFFKNIDRFDIIILAIPDRDLVGVVDLLVRNISTVRGKILLHTSGTLSHKILSPLKEKGFITGSLHPYFSFYKKRGDLPLNSIRFSLSCSKKDEQYIFMILKKAGVVLFSLDDRMKVPYHISAVFVSNFSALLLKIARNILKRTGLANKEIDDLIFSLLDSTIYNLREFGIDSTITGPAIRGDENIIEIHKRFLSENLPAIAPLYSLCTSIIQTLYR